MVIDKKPAANAAASASATKTGQGPAASGASVKKPQPPQPLIPPAKSVPVDKKKPAGPQAKTPGATPKALDDKNKKGEGEKTDENNDKNRNDQENGNGQKKKKRIVIPFVTPWESRPALQSQSGMGAFGTKIEIFKTKGGKPMPTDTGLRSENILTLFAETNKFSSQSGMHAFGAHRDNVVHWENRGKDIDEDKLRLCQLVIPKQSGNNVSPTQAGHTPMGAIRQQVMKIEYRPDMKEKMEKKSEAILTKFGTPNPNCHAGTGVMDRFRKQVPDIAIGARMKKGHDRRTESVLPKWAQLKHLPTPAPVTGAGNTGLGPFRQVITPVTGGYSFSSDEIVASKKVVPWATSPDLQSQQGTGGFQGRRDVVTHYKF